MAPNSSSPPCATTWNPTEIDSDHFERSGIRFSTRGWSSRSACYSFHLMHATHRRTTRGSEDALHLRRGPGQHRDKRRRARAGLDAEAQKRGEHSPGDEDRRDAPERRDLARRIGAAEQSDDEPDPDHRAELAHRLVDGAAEGEPSRREAVDGRATQRGQDKTDPRSGHPRPREPGAEEAGWRLDGRVQERSPPRDDEPARDEHNPMSA